MRHGARYGQTNRRGECDSCHDVCNLMETWCETCGWGTAATDGSWDLCATCALAECKRHRFHKVPGERIPGAIAIMVERGTA